MNTRLFAISFNTFREAVRDRVLYNLIVFVLLLVASAPLFEQISIGLERLIPISVGLSAISIIGTVIAVLIGIGLVYKEMEKKTLYTILCRPVRRWEFIAGKYLGLMMTLVVNTLLMTVGFYLALLAIWRGLSKGDAELLVAIYFIVLQFFIVTALALFFSSFSTPILSAIFTFAMVVIGTFAEDLRNFAALAQGPTHWLATVAAYLAPNFSALNVISQVAHSTAVAGKLVVLNTVYALLYSAAAIAAAVLIFERRNLK